MPLRVLAGPGCDDVGKTAYVDAHRDPGDVVISAGRLYDSLTGDGSIPSSNSAALRMALYLRTTAIRQARERELNGWVLTSNGNRADLDRLAAEAGSPGVTVLKMTEAQACGRIAALVSSSDRRAACEEGIKRRWFGRYRPSSSDREVEP